MDEMYYIARKLRKNSTEQERKLWKILRNRQFHNCKFKRQVPIGDYVVDFLCEEKKLVIEVDGGHHNEPKEIEYDNKRTEFLTKKGYKVVRLWNNDINDNLEGVYEYLSNQLNS